MKKFFIVMMIACISSLSYAMNKLWKNVTNAFLKDKAIQRIIQSSGNVNIPLVSQLSSNLAYENFFLILVYSQDDKDKKYYMDFKDTTYQSFQELCWKLSSQVSYSSSWSCIYFVISFAYSKNNYDASRCLAALMHQMRQRHGAIATYAFGESAHIVNVATRVYEKEFAKKNSDYATDIIIHVQSPIYEYAWSYLDNQYVYNQQWSPTCFKELYHFYTKAVFPAFNMITYPDRKYRQQTKKENSYTMPVKNIRMLKEDTEKQLVDMSMQEIKGYVLLDNIRQLLRGCQEYKINFDFIAKGFNENDMQKYTIIAVNRLVDLIQGNLIYKYGDGNGQEYRLGHIESERNFWCQLLKERDMSNKKLLELKRVFGAHKDLQRIIKEHEELGNKS